MLEAILMMSLSVRGTSQSAFCLIVIFSKSTIGSTCFFQPLMFSSISS